MQGFGRSGNALDVTIANIWIGTRRFSAYNLAFVQNPGE
jgi:hypothetical protein